MDKRKKYYMTLDVETAGGLGNPLVYDIGFAISDKSGNVYASASYIISEIFYNKKLMSTAYYAEKVPMYEKEIASGSRTVITFMEMREKFFEMMRIFNAQVICAYNLNFDMRALSNTTKHLANDKKVKFLASEFKTVDLLCIWSLACEVLYIQKTFRKVATSQNWLTEKGNFQTSAEIGHRYITGENEFEENHTGLEDVFIEIGIMEKCFRQHKKHESGIIAHPWRIPNKLKGE